MNAKGISIGGKHKKEEQLGREEQTQTETNPKQLIKCQQEYTY